MKSSYFISKVPVTRTLLPCYYFASHRNKLRLTKHQVWQSLEFQFSFAVVNCANLSLYNLQGQHLHLFFYFLNLFSQGNKCFGSTQFENYRLGHCDIVLASSNKGKWIIFCYCQGNAFSVQNLCQEEPKSIAFLSSSSFICCSIKILGLTVTSGKFMAWLFKASSR